jgi:hypothetical protein
MAQNPVEGLSGATHFTYGIASEALCDDIAIREVNETPVLQVLEIISMLDQRERPQNLHCSILRRIQNLWGKLNEVVWGNLNELVWGKPEEVGQTRDVSHVGRGRRSVMKQSLIVSALSLFNFPSGPIRLKLMCSR